MKPSFAVLLAGSAAILTSCAIPAQREEPAQQGQKARDSLRYESLSRGADSWVDLRRYDLIGSPQRLEEVWSEHCGGGYAHIKEFRKPDETSKPEVDFGRCLVIAIFGSEFGKKYFECKDLLEDGETVRFRFKSYGYSIIVDSFEESTKPRQGDGPFVVCRVVSYGFFMIPRTEKPIVIEEDISGDISGMRNAPPVWKERTRLDPKAAR